MDIKIGDKVRFNQLGLSTPVNDSVSWLGIDPESVTKAMNSGTGTVLRVVGTHIRINFQESLIDQFFWPAEFFEKVPEEEKLEFTQEEKELLRGLVQDKLKGYQQLLDKLQ